MSSEWRDLENSLTGLGGDVAGAELPGPDAARARARQRTRRRTASVALAAAFVVAGGGLAVGQLAGIDSAEVQPAGPSDSTQTPTEPAPTPALDDGDPTESPDVEIEPPVDFLDPDELAPMIDPDDGSEVAWVGSDPLPGLGLDTCATTDFDLGGERRWYVPERPVPDYSDIAPNDADASRWSGATQLIFLPGDPEQGFEALRDTYRDCAESSGFEVAVTGLGDDAYIDGLMIDTEDDEFGRVMLVGAARTGAYVTVVIRQYPHWVLGPLPGRNVISPIDLDLAAAVNKLCELEDAGACATDPVFEEDPVFEDPDIEVDLHELADDPLLTDDDINPVGTYDGFVPSESTGPSGELYEPLCLGPFLAADFEGSTGVWSHEGEGEFTEAALQAADDQSANELFGELETLPDECGEVSDTHEQTVNQPEPIEVDGVAAMAWTVTTEPTPEDLGSEPFFGGVGMARNANIVVVITFTAFDDPTGGGWNDYAARTLAAALDRAIAE